MTTKSSMFKYLFLFSLLLLATIIYAKVSSTSEAFSPAKDFPEGALIYAQFQDLPALYKIWDESELKQKYLESTNFNEFENRHLAMKLVSRLEEFQAASNFPLDVSAIISSSETSAAIAVYDIGRLEFIFVAPLSEEKMLASNFILNKSAFEEAMLEDGTVFYSRSVEADRGRQKQKLLFATSRGRFILGTDEVNFFKTLTIINGKSKEKNLLEVPQFKNLTAKIEPHLATIWVDQRRLNDDWYFKHYWAFRNLENLKKIRAGIFDFEMKEKEILEHRKFLLNSDSAGDETKLSAPQINSLQRYIPEDAAYLKFQSAQNLSNISAQKIYQTLFDGFSASGGKDEDYAGRNSSNRYYFQDYSENYGENGYTYLGEKFESEINEEAEDFENTQDNSSEKSELISDLQNIIEAANPNVSASLISPQVLPMPLFFECRRGFILSVQNAKNLNRAKLENVISKLAINQLTVSQDTAKLSWKTVEENGEIWREMSMPMLGWKLVYAEKNNEIVFANSANLLSSMLENDSEQIFEADESKNGFDDLTVLRLNQHEAAFDAVMREIKKAEAKLDEESVDFFVDNIGSLFEVLSEVKRVEIKKSSSNNYLTEELKFVLN